MEDKKAKNMNVKELLDKELSFEETNDFLDELMGFSIHIVTYSDGTQDEIVRIVNDEGSVFDHRTYIGEKPINRLSNILLLKEKIDEERGEWRGRSEVQQSIKQALGI